MQFLTYDSTGNFTGAYIQDAAPTGVSYIEVDAATYANWINLCYQNGTIVARPVVTPAPVEADYIAAVQAHLDSAAQHRNFDSILSACTYATSTNSKFQAEGQACVAWRDACWAYCYTALASVQAGALTAPTVAALIAELPTLTWPD